MLQIPRWIMNPPSAYVSSIATVSAAGLGLAELRKTLLTAPERRLPSTTALSDKPLAWGLVQEALLPEPAVTRTERLVLACLAQIENDVTRLIARLGSDRVGVVLGSCTAGSLEIERGMREHAQTGALPDDFDIAHLNIHEPARFLADRLGITGPVWTLSNACASGSIALISAVRLVTAGLAEAVIAGGIDGASHLTTAGFQALGAVSAEPSKPFDRNRCGINLGEGGALFVVTRQAPDAKNTVAVAGYCETSDAHHISAPDPSGAQACRCMREALAMSGLSPQSVDLVSAHGTGTTHNDEAEMRAVSAVFGADVPLVSYKALSGHTLAGAGALQCAIAAALLTENPQGVLPSPGVACPETIDAPVRLLTETVRLGRPLKAVMTNAFAFGGSNASVLFSRV
ncbi:MAG: beta-ketoacyl synthase N-terminal-like domain-containing protein [Duodenibacillus sp.]